MATIEDVIQHLTGLSDSLTAIEKKEEWEILRPSLVDLYREVLSKRKPEGEMQVSYS